MKKKKIKTIFQPRLNDAVKLTSLQLNDLNYVNRHTVITPQRLENDAAESNKRLNQGVI